MDTSLTHNGTSELAEQVLETLLSGGDLGRLSPQQKVQYLVALCKSVGLNPLSRPIEFITMNGKTVPYAKKDCTDQLRKIHGISVEIVSRETAEGVYTVTARATTPEGRSDEDVGSVTVNGLKGDAMANATMKAHTKAKRRVTLSICGLGILDESEIETIPGARFEQPITPVIVRPSVENQIEASHELIGKYAGRIANANSVTELRDVGADLAKEPSSIGSLLRIAYGDRQKALKERSKQATQNIINEELGRNPGEEG